ncbi:MAG: TlpA family protein disulfide reductase [Bacteroidetes bacterium]|nr:MAG: TlpA family protein disulfide reductase [Bacteroidota bacterium]
MKTMIQHSENKFRIMRVVTFTMIIGTILSFTSCDNNSVDEMTDTENPGDMGTTVMAPAFELKSLAGNTVKLSDFKNKVVVLFFFGNSCPSCKAAAPNVQTMIQNTFGSNASFMLLGIDQWDGNASSVESFMKSTGVTFPLLLMGSSTAKAYSTTYDRLVVIDKNGNIMFSGKQGAANDLAAVKAKVEALLK